MIPSNHKLRSLFPGSQASTVNIEISTELADPGEGPLRRYPYDPMRALLPAMEKDYEIINRTVYMVAV